LAISASYVDFFERKPGISPKALHHISQAYALVNLKLSGPESVSDSTIAAVISLAIYQQVHNLHSTGLVHLKGLYRMIQLRGGIARLMKENRALALKPLRYVHASAAFLLPFHSFPLAFLEAESLTTTRLDVELALQTGLPALFPSDAVVPVNDIAGDSSIIKEQLLGTSSRLLSIMLSVVSFAGLLNGREGKGQTKLDPLSYTEAIVSLLYRLIEVAPLGQPQPLLGGLYDDVTHLAMLAFMTTLLPEYGHNNSSYLLLSDSLESAIQNLHVIGGVSVLKRKNHRWLILDTCERLGLHDWPVALRQLCGFPWIHTLHDDPGRSLWEDAQRRSTDISREFVQLEGR
jgi:hypothetical protein